MHVDSVYADSALDAWPWQLMDHAVTKVAARCCSVVWCSQSAVLNAYEVLRQVDSWLTERYLHQQGPT